MFKLNVPKGWGSIQENVISGGLGHRVVCMENKEWKNNLEEPKVNLIFKKVQSKETWREEYEDLIVQTNDDKLCILYSI